MKLSSFKYEISPDLIAQRPLENRDDSRLMVVHKDTGKIEHKMFKDVLDEFDEGDVFVANDTKVFPAKLYGNKEKTGAVIEVFLLRELNRESILWDVLVDPARKIRIGNKLYFGENDELVAEVIDNTTSRGRTLRFLFDGSYEEFMAVIAKLGETPIPKYLQREVEPEDRERFQTIYADKLGAVAVPGEHGVLVARLKELDIGIVDVRAVLFEFLHFIRRIKHLDEHSLNREHLETILVINLLHRGIQNLLDHQCLDRHILHWVSGDFKIAVGDHS